MSYLINRTPPARIKCLHNLIKFIKKKYGFNIFRMNDVKYNNHQENIHKYCDLLVKDLNYKISYCPYLSNPLSGMGCYLTKSIDDDTTKSKEISNTINSLEALGFINRNGNDLNLTKSGSDFAEVDFNSEESLKIIKKSILNYGQAVGVLFQIKTFSKTFDTNNIIVGYPDTKEVTQVAGQRIVISAGSERDSNIRTKSCILAWLTTAGYIMPANVILSNGLPHTSTLEYTLSNSSRNARSYKILNIPDIFNNNFITNNPLDYNNLIKSIRALRENGQASSRQATMRFENVIKNRRYAIITILNKSFYEGSSVSFESLVKIISRYPDYFVIDKSDIERIISKELEISFSAGIPIIISTGYIKPTAGVNQTVLQKNAPEDLVKLVDKMYKDLR